MTKIKRCRINSSRYTQNYPPEIFRRRTIRIVIEGLRGEDSIIELCRREGINSNIYYDLLKEATHQNEASIDAVAKALIRFEEYRK